MPELTHERLLEVLEYSPITGLFTNRIARGIRSKAGSTAGTIGGNGYVYLRLDKVLYLAHRLAWFYVTGEWPEHEVDHKNNQRSHNMWINLRPANRWQQRANSLKSKTGTSGFKGVTYSKKAKKYIAQIQVNKKNNYLGTFDTPEEAAAVYQAAAAQHFGEYAKS